jgi:hypothetical protein
MKRGKEIHIKRFVRQVLTNLQNGERVKFQMNNTGAFRIGKSFVKFGEVGSPDVYVFYDDGVLHIELKAPTGKQSESQKCWEKSVSKFTKNHYYVVRTTWDFVDILERHGIIYPGEISVREEDDIEQAT